MEQRKPSTRDEHGGKEESRGIWNPEPEKQVTSERRKDLKEQSDLSIWFRQSFLYICLALINNNILHVFKKIIISYILGHVLYRLKS